MEGTETFKIAIAYAKPATAIRAKEMAERLAAQLDFECDAWPFEWLNVGRVREHAAMIASRADMIIIAAGGQEELPDGVTDWVESWLLQRNSQPAVLVALFDDDSVISPAKTPQPCAYLQRIAEQAGMDYFCNLGGLWKPDAADEDPEYSATR